MASATDETTESLTTPSTADPIANQSESTLVENTEVQGGEEITETKGESGAEVQKDDVTLQDRIESAHDQIPGNAEVLVLEADFSVEVRKLYSYDEFQHVNVSGGNFLKGVKWSPDGTCFLTCSEDNIMRIFETPHQQLESITDSTTSHSMLKSVLQIKNGETIYDYSWYPQMNTSDPGTACFVTTSRDHPIQLWDAFTGKIRCSYRKYDQMDEISAAYGLCFSAGGEKIFCGFNGEVGSFYTNAPGRDYKKIIKFDKKNNAGIPGIISCFAVSKACPSCIACGSYAGYASVFDESTGDHLANFSDPKKQMNGVTQVLYSRDGWSLFVGCRKSNEILCWDLRFPVEEPYLRLTRNSDTNQRINFDIDGSGRYLISGSKDGTILVYDLHNNGQLLTSPFPKQADTVNGISVHPTMPLLAVSTGQRTFSMDDDEDLTQCEKNVVSVYQFNASWKSISFSENATSNQEISAAAT